MADFATSVASTGRRATTSPGGTACFTAVPGPVTLLATGEAATLTAVGSLHGDASAIDVGAVKTAHGVFGIPRIVEFDESVAGLEIEADNATVPPEDILEITFPRA